MIGRAFRGCCCALAFVVVVVALAVGWEYMQRRPETQQNAAAAQQYSRQVQRALSEYTKRVEEIQSDPRLREAVSAAQKHAAHIREMKQIVDAQQQCERALQGIHPPDSMAQAQSALLDYWHYLGEKYSEFSAQLKKQDVPRIGDELKHIDSQSSSARQSVDQAVQSIPHYDEARRELSKYWDQFKQQVDKAAPAVR